MTETQTEAPVSEDDESLSAVYASQGIVGEDAEAKPETQPRSKPAGTSPEPPQREAPKDAADDGADDGSSDEDKAKAQPERTLTQAEHEAEVEKRVQSALKAARERDAEKADRAAKERSDREVRDLFARAKGGDPKAQQELLRRNLADLGQKFDDEAYQNRLSTYAREKWEAHAAAFGLDPDDAELQGDGGATFEAINAVAIRKTTAAPLVEAMQANPAIKKWLATEVKAAVEKATKTTEKRTLAQALKSEDAPVSDTGRGAHGAVDDLESVEARIADGTATREDEALYRKLMSAAGRRV